MSATEIRYATTGCAVLSSRMLLRSMWYCASVCGYAVSGTEAAYGARWGVSYRFCTRSDSPTLSAYA
eukprot:1353383-Rhodomonas_salina.1